MSDISVPIPMYTTETGVEGIAREWWEPTKAGEAMWVAFGKARNRLQSQDQPTFIKPGDEEGGAAANWRGLQQSSFLTRSQLQRQEIWGLSLWFQELCVIRNDYIRLLILQLNCILKQR